MILTWCNRDPGDFVFPNPTPAKKNWDLPQSWEQNRQPIQPGNGSTLWFMWKNGKTSISMPKNLKTWHPYDVGFPALSYTLVSQLATKAMIAEIKLYSYGVLAVKEHVTPVKNNINKSQMTRAHDTEVCSFWEPSRNNWARPPQITRACIKTYKNYRKNAISIFNLYIPWRCWYRFRSCHFSFGITKGYADARSLAQKIVTTYKLLGVAKAMAGGYKSKHVKTLKVLGWLGLAIPRCFQQCEAPQLCFGL